MSNHLRVIVEFISMMIMAASNKDEFLEKMDKVSDFHFQRGITALEYGPFGEVLF
jgi:hypothetical protein